MDSVRFNDWGIEFSCALTFAFWLFRRMVRAGWFDPESLNDMPGLYLQIIAIAVGSGLLLLAVAKPIKKFIGDKARLLD